MNQFGFSTLVEEGEDGQQSADGQDLSGRGSSWVSNNANTRTVHPSVRQAGGTSGVSGFHLVAVCSGSSSSNTEIGRSLVSGRCEITGFEDVGGGTPGASGIGSSDTGVSHG